MPHLRANNVELYYQRHPQPGKPRLLLSHSLFFDHSMFAPLIAELGEAFDIVVYDHRGQGASERAAPLDMDTLADDAAALIDALDLAPCFVAGNSMGGFVALRLAARYPERLAGCAIMGSSADLEHQLPVFAPLVEDLGSQWRSPSYRHPDAHHVWRLEPERSCLRQPHGALARTHASPRAGHWRRRRRGDSTPEHACGAARIARAAFGAGG
ncbi:hypothetical protein LCGC14_0227480 [marine sediment metagenome]|uniref:AB hydrolase-1 domain-containing protein n=1 Tax=marine sediment metagenome TaxID=412755 RepID=A0A0F9WW33_9ZZZZ